MDLLKTARFSGRFSFARRRSAAGFLLQEGGARLYFSDCPPVPGTAEPLPPHQALEFAVGPEGMVEGRYLPL